MWGHIQAHSLSVLPLNRGSLGCSETCSASELSSPQPLDPRAQPHSLLCLFWCLLIRGLQVYPMFVSVTKPLVFKVPPPWSCDWTVPRLLPLESSRFPSG